MGGREGGLPHLTHLDLSGAQLNGGRTTLRVLIDFVRRGGGGSLVSLGLARCALGEEGGEGVREALEEGRCGKLEELRLR